MKKTFFQFGIGGILYFLSLCLFIGVGVYIIVEGSMFAKTLEGRVICAVLGGTMAIGMIMLLWTSACNRIIFLDNKISASGEKLPKCLRVQYEEEVFYQEIVDIRIVYSCKSSRKRIVGGPHGYSTYPRTFFEFELIGGKKKWVYISLFSKKQRSKMIEIINEKTGLNLSYDQILKESKGTKKSRE